MHGSGALIEARSERNVAGGHQHRYGGTTRLDPYSVPARRGATSDRPWVWGPRATSASYRTRETPIFGMRESAHFFSAGVPVGRCSRFYSMCVKREWMQIRCGQPKVDEKEREEKIWKYWEKRGGNSASLQFFLHSPLLSRQPDWHDWLGKLGHVLATWIPIWICVTMSFWSHDCICCDLVTSHAMEFGGTKMVTSWEFSWARFIFKL